MKKRKENKKEYKLNRRRIALYVLIAVIVVWYVNNFVLVTNTYTYDSPKTNGEITIAAVSDYHYESIGVSWKTVAKKIEKQKPDIIVFLGDMFSSEGKIASKEKNEEKILKLAQRLLKTAPLYVITGEHDYFTHEYFEKLRNLGAIVLWDEQSRITVNGTEILLTGISRINLSGNLHLDDNYPTDPNAINILLAHIPKVVATENPQYDIILSGDSHGGIMQIPFYGAIYYEYTLFPKNKPHYQNLPIYDKGQFELGSSTLFVTGGVGWSPMPLRFGNMPEVMVIKIK